MCTKKEKGKRERKRVEQQKQVQTGCPKQEKIIPPMAAETITTTKSEISLKISTFQDDVINDILS